MKPSELFSRITQQTGVYNIQSISNIPSIIDNGLLSNELASEIEHISIAMAEVQNRRDNIFIPNGLQLHKYANLYFDPKNPMLYKRKAENENLCILKFDKSVLDIQGVVISDRNASSKYASFYSPNNGLQFIDFEMVYATDWTDVDEYRYWLKKSVKCAEVLIPYRVPYKYIVGAAVYDEKAKQVLESFGFDKKIYVDNRYFF